MEEELTMVMIVQLLCPERHCLLASAYEEGVGSFQEACDGLKGLLVPTGPFKARCELCGSEVLHYEEGRTKFATLIEATPFLTQTMLANMATRAELEKNGMLYDQQRRN